MSLDSLPSGQSVQTWRCPDFHLWKDVDRVGVVLQLETCTSDWPPALVRCHASPLPKCPKRQHLPASEHVEPVRHKISRYRRQIKNKPEKNMARENETRRHHGKLFIMCLSRWHHKLSEQFLLTYIHIFRKRQMEKLKINCEKYPKSPKEILLP